MFGIEAARGEDFAWAQAQVALHHYLRKAVDPRSRPLAYVVRVGAVRAGTLIFGRTQSTKCFQGELTYGGAADVAGGRAKWDRWEVLNLARVWLAPDVQRGGALCVPGRVPGFTDRKGAFRPTLASAAIAAALARVGADYLLAHPPVFVEQPYEVRVVLSYCDTRVHKGTLYRACGFRLSRRNADGVETWYTQAVTPLTAAQHAAVRAAAASSPRSRRVRAKRRQGPSLWDMTKEGE